MIVIGAGAAGLVAAISASGSGAAVLVLEKMERAGRKLLITGKGRCNITNDTELNEFFNHIQPHSRFLKHAFSQFFTGDIIRLLNESGVKTVVERGKRVFPASNKSSDVVQALVKQAQKNKVVLQYRSKVNEFLTDDNQVQGVKMTKEGITTDVFAGKIILCTGGNSYPATGSDGDGYRLAKSVGHSIEPVRPSLVPLETKGDLAKKLQGLSLKNINAVVWVNGKKQKEEFGEMLFTHFGLSGPVILTLSRFVVDALHENNPVELSVDLKPALDEQKLDNRLLRDLNEYSKKRLDNIFRLWLPAKLIPVFIEKLTLDPAKEGHQLSAAERKKIRLLMKDLRFEVTGHRSFKEAIITAGGISTKEIDSKTMESKLIKNLFFAGEVIDLDADTGGYNLQIAWSTGWLAGKSAANF